jgi:hypothetical protein
MFYTYLWLREDGTPYYVGKGKAQRAWRTGSPPAERVIVQEHISEDDAYTAECFLISHYGRIDLGTGCLRNYTDGGEGQSGRVVPEDVRKKLSEAGKGRVFSEESCRKISKALTGKSPHPRLLDQLGEKNWMFGKTTSDAQKEAVRKMWKDPVYRQRMLTIHKGRKCHTQPHTSGTKRVISEKVKNLWKDPVYRQHMSDVHKKKV